MTSPPLTQADLLELWERGEGARTARRARALLAAVQSEETVDTMTVGRRDAVLLALRERLFGSALTGITSCPGCGTEIELTFDASEVRRHAAAADETFTVAGIEFRLPRAADLERLEGITDLEAARAALLASCIASTDVDPQSISPAISEAAAARMSELDPQADVTFDLACPSCERAWREPFDVLTFLTGELAAHARRLLADVHLLASAYGWSESDIVRMSPRRRDVYIGMLS